ncbi:MAG: hypothetical protein IGR76_04145 [Synechococcales cyanobacterium T60_A2020_003]|nr:hypothetical protein [Synechococcales cyanobacterium T60_A2020_003]
MMPLVLQLTESSNVLFSKTLAYPTPSAAESVDSRVTEVAIAIHGNTSAIASQAIDLKPRTLTDIFVVGGLTAPRSAEIVIAPPT